MKRRDIYILIGLGVVVLIVAWYFLLISPKRSDLGEVQDKRDQAEDLYKSNQSRIERLPEEKNAARQATEELLKLNKLTPVDEQVPSLIIELNESADDAGVEFLKIEPDVAVKLGTDTVIPMELKFEGRFIDVVDFLYRVESYAKMDGANVNVSGRFVNVVDITLEEGEFEKWPYVTVVMGVNTYMTQSPPASATADRTKAEQQSSEEGAT